jgi:hypothetical protein
MDQSDQTKKEKAPNDMDTFVAPWFPEYLPTHKKQKHLVWIKNPCRYVIDMFRLYRQYEALQKRNPHMLQKLKTMETAARSAIQKIHPDVWSAFLQKQKGWKEKDLYILQKGLGWHLRDPIQTPSWKQKLKQQDKLIDKLNNTVVELFDAFETITLEDNDEEKNKE